MDFLHWLALILNFIAGISILGLLIFHDKVNLFDFWHKLALWIGSIGLLGAVVEQLLFLYTGITFHSVIPFWMFIYGPYWIITYSVYYKIINRNIKNED